MSLRTVEYCVFDEADRLFEMGFAAQLREILSKMNESRQVLLHNMIISMLLSLIERAYTKHQLPLAHRGVAGTKLVASPACVTPEWMDVS